jgi:hypothetical protein
MEVQEKQILFGQVRKINSDVDKTRTITFEASNGNVDRHMSTLNPDGWELDAFNANSIVGYQHNVYGDDFCNPPNPDDVIGKGRAYMEDGILLTDITFEDGDNNPLAEKIFNKVKNGFLKAVSVGFLGIGDSEIEKQKDEKGNIIGEIEHFKGQELLEISVVNIPSNRTALKKDFRDAAARAIGFIKRQLPEFNYAEIEQMRLCDLLALMKGEKTVKDYKEDIINKIKKYQIEFEENITTDFNAIINNNQIKLNEKKLIR